MFMFFLLAVAIYLFIRLSQTMEDIKKDSYYYFAFDKNIFICDKSILLICCINLIAILVLGVLG